MNSTARGIDLSDSATDVVHLPSAEDEAVYTEDSTFRNSYCRPGSPDCPGDDVEIPVKPLSSQKETVHLDSSFSSPLRRLVFKDVKSLPSFPLIMHAFASHNRFERARRRNSLRQSSDAKVLASYFGPSPVPVESTGNPSDRHPARPKHPMSNLTQT